MNRFFKFLSIFLILFLIDGMPIYVYAETDIIHKCIGGKRYQIDYDNEYVKPEDIDYGAIQSGYASGAEGFNEADKEKYKIDSMNVGDKCTESDGVIAICPTSELGSYFNKGGKFSAKTLNEKGKVSIKYNLSKGKYDIVIDDVFENRVYIRKVPNLNTKNNSYNSKSYYNSNEFLKPSNGKYYITANPGEQVWLEFYEKSDSGCNEVYVSEYLYVMENYDSIRVENPALTIPDSSAYIVCQKLRNDKTILSSDKDMLKRSIVPYCYGSEKPYEDKDLEKLNKWNIKIDEYKQLDKLISDGYRVLVENYSVKESSDVSDDKITSSTDSGKKCSSASGSTKCSQSESRSSTFVVYADSNFVATCTDNYSSVGDKAKFTTAGAGFSYDVGYSVNRSCSMRFVGSIARLKPQCTCNVIVTHTQDDLNDQSGKIPSDGGPDEDFDICVNECDGGAYSQNCINSCYSKVYGDDSKRDALLEEMAFTFKSSKTLNLLDKKAEIDYSLKRLSVTLLDGVGNQGGGITVGPPEPGRTQNGNLGLRYPVTVNGTAHCHYTLSNWCQGRETYAYVVVGPDGCSWDPWGEYNRALNGILASRDGAYNAISQAIPGSEVVTYNIIDSYLKDDKGNYYKFKIDSSSTGLKVKKNGTGGSPSVSGAGSVTIGDQGHTASLYSSSASRTITASLPDAYLGKIYGDVVYRTGNNSYSIKKNGNKYVLLNPYAGTSLSFNSSDYYDGSDKYYTSLYTDNLNVTGSLSTGVSLVNKDACYNIDVSVSNLAGRYSMSNSCYYGVFNNYISTPDPDDPDCTEKNGNKDGECSGIDGPVGEIRYIFRPIELTDVFPERNPRWNWTNSASLNINGNDPYLGYNVNPKKTTEHIESAGHKIINDVNQELDYEIIIDRQGLARIKSYNKKVGSYTNFDLNCKVRGATLCKSDFLDSAMYIKNAGNTRVNATIGTNND